MYFLPSTNEFIDPRIVESIPESAVEITQERLRQLLEGQAEGKRISADENGNPVLVEHEASEQTYPSFTALEMLDLFTEEEQLAVVEATMTVPAIKLWYDRLIASTFVTYADARTEEGLQTVMQAGYITPQRKDEIVARMQPPAAQQ